MRIGQISVNALLIEQGALSQQPEET